jgi:hypothetical protein
MNPRALRLLRGMLVTGTTVAIAATAHLVAGGTAPGRFGIAIALLVGSILGLWLLDAPRLGPARTTLVVAGGQVVLHTVFGWGAPGLETGDAHGAHGVAPTSELSAAAAHDHSGMLLAHVVAGVLSVALLLAEQCLVDGIVALAARVLQNLRPLASAPIPAARAALPLTRDAVRPRGRSSLPPPLRRGPPTLLSIG